MRAHRWEAVVEAEAVVVVVAVVAAVFRFERSL